MSNNLGFKVHLKEVNFTNARWLVFVDVSLEAVHKRLSESHLLSGMFYRQKKTGGDSNGNNWVILTPDINRVVPITVIESIEQMPYDVEIENV